MTTSPSSIEREILLNQLAIMNSLSLMICDTPHHPKLTEVFRTQDEILSLRKDATRAALDS